VKLKCTKEPSNSQVHSGQQLEALCGSGVLLIILVVSMRCLNNSFPLTHSAITTAHI